MGSFLTCILGGIDFAEGIFHFWKYLFTLIRSQGPGLHLSSCFWLIASTSQRALHGVYAPKDLKIPQGYLRGLFWHISWEGSYQVRILFFYSYMWHSQSKSPTWLVLISEIQAKMWNRLQKLKKNVGAYSARQGPSCRSNQSWCVKATRTTRHGEYVGKRRL